LENKKQEKKPIQLAPFSFENRPHRSRTTMEANQKQPLKKSRQESIGKDESEQVNIPIT
jgi:hypothetical protein